VRGDETIAAQYGIHSSQVGDWKMQAAEELKDICANKTERRGAVQEAKLKDMRTGTDH